MIFEPFFTTRQDNDGMGMGLFIVKNILNTINSNIIVREGNEGETIFEIELKRGM
jgi:C4-dicarboxylate-specific signal transduction histidine kinase